MGRARSLVTGASLLTLAVVIGMVTALAAFVWANGLKGHKALEQPTLSAVVARADIPAGTKLTATLVQVRDVATKDALPGAVQSIDLAAGRTLRYPVVGGEQITDAKLVATSLPNGDGLAFSVPPGFRGLSVEVSEISGAGGLIVPGDRVDILVSTTYGQLQDLGASAPNSPDPNRPVVLTVLQDVLVLAVGQTVTQPLDAGRDPATLRPTNAAAQPQAKSVTVAVQPPQAQALFMATNQGKLGLALRAFGDASEQTLDPTVRLQSAGSGTISQVSR